jgi:hypothetical protein
MMTMSELMRRTYGNGMQQTPYVEEVNTPRMAIEDIPTRRVSKGNGQTLIATHVFSQKQVAIFRRLAQSN